MYINSIKDIQKVKLQPAGYIINGNVFVPKDPANKHYQLIQEWLAEGNKPEPMYTLNELKQQKLVELKAKFHIEMMSPMFSNILNAYVNFGIEHIQNVKDLITYNELHHLDTIEFRLYDNSFITISQEQLHALYVELLQHKNTLYKRKWELEQLINQASTVEELEQIDINFTDKKT